MVTKAWYPLFVFEKDEAECDTRERESMRLSTSMMFEVEGWRGGRARVEYML